MASIKLKEIPSFAGRVSGSNSTSRINNISVHELNRGNYYPEPVVCISDDRYSSMYFFEGDGDLYCETQTRDINKIRSFRKLGLQSINANQYYQPNLTLVDASLEDKIFVIDSKLNPKDGTQHVVKYSPPPYDYSHPNKKRSFRLDDVVIQLDNKTIEDFAVVESRTYDTNQGGYVAYMYCLDNHGKAHELSLKDYNDKLSKSPQTLNWSPLPFNNKSGLIKLFEGSAYYSKGDALYAFGIKTSASSSPQFSMELINKNALKSSTNWFGNMPATVGSADEILLHFGDNIDYNNTFPLFDSGVRIDEKEFLVTLIPVLDDKINYGFRDLYWFKLNNKKDEAYLIAPPHRIGGIDRNDVKRNEESSVSIQYFDDKNEGESYVYMATGQNTVRKYVLDLKP